MRSVEAAVRGGVDWVQIRERELPGAALLDHAAEIVRAARAAAAERGGAVTLLVNRRIDVALAIGADGVHLGFDAVDAATARRLLGAEARIGWSAHAASELAGAPPELSYAHLAPIFAPLSKPATRPALQPPALTAAARHGVPVLAQGGVTADNASALIEAGAAGVAVTGTILSADDPAAAAAALRASLDAAGRAL